MSQSSAQSYGSLKIPDDTAEALVQRYIRMIEEELKAIKRLEGPERAERFLTIITAAECGKLFSR